ncbi:pectin acetylesterase 5-like [Hordeum vulgare]|nr:pectin acetylesterase 5-like [Hordeum vulgare]
MLMDVTLVVGAREKGATCVDETPPVYHWLPGFWDGSDKWLLHLEGGSWCRNLTWCTQRKETNLGSSDHIEMRAEFMGILSNDALHNPDSFFMTPTRAYQDGAPEPGGCATYARGGPTLARQWLTSGGFLDGGGWLPHNRGVSRAWHLLQKSHAELHSLHSSSSASLLFVLKLVSFMQQQ